MKILSIETSCDETAISILEAGGNLDQPYFEIIGNSLISQINIHREFGGVYPSLAKREHAKNLVPVLDDVFKKSGDKIDFKEDQIHFEKLDECKKILERELGLLQDLENFFKKNKQIPDIDLLVVTSGPGLAPALWVGVCFAKAISLAWGIPLLRANHMEGHIASVLLGEKVDFPAIALLISGGHTEIVLAESWGKYNLLGQTLDDAVGEAFDKVARMIGLPYPGGPEVSKLAKSFRAKNLQKKISLPRPMINSKDLNFSFSGLKTAVLYKIKEIGNLDKDKEEICAEFEEAVTDVLIKKLESAISCYRPKSLIVGGGVISNDFIKEKLKEFIGNKYDHINLCLADKNLATDNAIMIAMAGYISYLSKKDSWKNDFDNLSADGNLKYAH